MDTSSRDPLRTRVRILRAARREFVRKGFAGARVDAIARAASVNKRMLYHYFGNKEALFRAILREGIATNLDLVAAAPADAVDLLPFLFERASKRGEGIRLLQWEALGSGDRKPIAEEERRKAWVEGTERLRDAQRAGLLHGDCVTCTGGTLWGLQSRVRSRDSSGCVAPWTRSGSGSTGRPMSRTTTCSRSTSSRRAS